MADVFISYSREDAGRVRLLIEMFTRYGLSVAYDELFVRDEDFRDRILREIAESGVVVVCWSKAAAASKWVNREAREAERREKYLGCQIAQGGAGFDFDDRNHDDLTRWNGDHKDSRFLKFFSELGRRIGRDEIAGLEAAERARLDQEKRTRETAEESERQAKAVADAKAAALVAAERRHEEERRRREAERLRSFWEKITPSERTLRLFFWSSPFLAALAFFPMGILALYLIAIPCRGAAIVLDNSRAGWVTANSALWVLMLYLFWSASGDAPGDWCSEIGATCGFRNAAPPDWCAGGGAICGFQTHATPIWTAEPRGAP